MKLNNFLLLSLLLTTFGCHASGGQLPPSDDFKSKEFYQGPDFDLGDEFDLDALVAQAQAATPQQDVPMETLNAADVDDILLLYCPNCGKNFSPDVFQEHLTTCGIQPESSVPMLSTPGQQPALSPDNCQPEASEDPQSDTTTAIPTAEQRLPTLSLPVLTLPKPAKDDSSRQKGSGSHACTLCIKNFSTPGSLKRHMDIHTGEKKFICDKCLKSFTRKDLLDVHTRTHTGEKRYACDQCEKDFTQLESLKKHMRSHTGETPYQCDICQKRFARKYVFENHKKVHDKGFYCTTCSITFSDKEALNTHNRIHGGENPYRCDICEKIFSRKYEYDRHMLIHSDKKPFMCPCGRDFAQEGNFKNHQKICTQAYMDEDDDEE